jgi:hypothetical protein
VIRVSGGGALHLGALIVQNGAASNGGAVACDGAELTIEAAALTGSRAIANGGALFGKDCAIQIEDTVMTGNQAEHGGAIAVHGGALALRGAALAGNHGQTHGGALYVGGETLIEDSTLEDNRTEWTGGAIYVHGRPITIRTSLLRGNHAAWEGGAIYFHQSEAVLEDNQILANTSFDDGGGLRVFESPARLERNRIEGNHSIDGDGGGMKISHVAAELIDNQILNNQALGAGGGIELDNDSSVVRGGVIAGNSSSIGGGVHIMLWPWNGGLLEDVRIEGNDAWRGGGMYIENNFQEVTLRRLVIEANTAAQGAAVYTRGSPLVLSSSLIHGNTAEDVGGAFYVDPSASYPWTEECPCPPIDPPARIEFVTADANPAEGGSAVWIGAPNVTFESSIFTGHTTTAVIAAPGGAPTWRYNDTFPASFVGMPDPTGGYGNLSTDPGYTTDYRLAASSACVDAGNPEESDPDGSRADMGGYAGPDAMP